MNEPKNPFWELKATIMRVIANPNNKPETKELAKQALKRVKELAHEWTE